MAYCLCCRCCTTWGGSAEKKRLRGAASARRERERQGCEQRGRDAGRPRCLAGLRMQPSLAGGGCSAVPLHPDAWQGGGQPPTACAPPSFRVPSFRALCTRLTNAALTRQEERRRQVLCFEVGQDRVVAWQQGEREGGEWVTGEGPWVGLGAQQRGARQDGAWPQASKVDCCRPCPSLREARTAG